MVNKSQLNLSDPFWCGLACAALSPALRSILVLDGESSVLQIASKVMKQLLSEVTGQKVRLVILGTTETEEDLWGHWALGQREGVFEWQMGLLTADELRLILIPDLAQLSLSAARACVVLMGAEIAHLERHGQHQECQPRLCWLAGCATSSIGRVSSHLLDRFALRLNGKVIGSVDRTTDLLRWLEQEKPEFEIETLPSTVKDQLVKAVRVIPSVNAEALAQVLTYFPNSESSHMRRQVALIRLAIAYSKLENLEQVTVAQVNRAAQMIGLRLTSPLIAPVSKNGQSLNEPVQPLFTTEPAEQDKAIAADPLREARSTVGEPVYQSDEPEELPFTSLRFERPLNPYPEDDDELIQRDVAALQIPLRRFRAAAGRGIVIGVETATSPQDLALVNTLLEAAKWQKIRQDLRQNETAAGIEHRQTELILSATDLRRYRRVPVAEQMLVLVLDYTCLRDCRWREALLPYLSWAYVDRASVCLVQVGAVLSNIAQLNTKVANVTLEELRAQKIVERSILVPRFSAGLEVKPGRATPLAHGLSLAEQTLRHALQHGRSAVQSAVLVVVSDGRGNVPIEPI